MRRLMNKIKPGGFSLIEVSAAMAILLLAIAGLSEMLWQGFTAAKKSQEHTAAHNLAREAMETYSDWNSLPGDGTYANPSPYPVVLNNVTYNFSLGVTTAQAGLKRIDVTVSWSRGSFSLISLKADY